MAGATRGLVSGGRAGSSVNVAVTSQRVRNFDFLEKRKLCAVVACARRVRAALRANERAMRESNEREKCESDARARSRTSDSAGAKRALGEVDPVAD